MKIKKLESGNHVFTEQFRRLLLHVFPRGMTFKTTYFIGEDTDSGAKGLYFELQIKKAGVLYMNFMELKDYEVVADIEDNFFASVTEDLMMAGVVHLTNNGMRVAEMTDQVNSPAFKNVMPSPIIFLN